MTRTARHKRVGRGMVKTLPSMLTLGNLLSGFAAIFYASRDPGTKHMLQDLSPLTIAAGFIFLGMVFDALDGRVARMTRNTSDLGEQLDSLADMVCCGVAPAFLVIHLVGIGTPFFGMDAAAGDAVEMSRADTLFDRLVLLVAGVYAACCALRLARFNAEIDQPEEADHMSFKGMPSPAAAGMVASLVLVHEMFDKAGNRDATIAVGIILVALTFVVAAAMVSNIRYVHFTNRFLRGRAPFQTIAGVVILLVPLLIKPQITVATVFVAYTLSGPVLALWQKARPPKTT